MADGPPVPDWENPAVVHRNRLDARATYTPFADPDEASSAASSRSLTLNGEWKFRWSPRPQERPKNFYAEVFDVSDWDDIVVPGNWQTQGFGTPIYTNYLYPFVKDPPRVTTEPPKDHTQHRLRNPVGSYRRSFELPPSWGGKRIFLHLGGVKSAFYVWVNGTRVGYSQDSMSPAEFEVSELLRPGLNTVALEVYRWSDGSYLEDQDMWRLSGVFRDVTLLARPKTYLHDFTIRSAATEGEASDAAVTVALDIRSKVNGVVVAEARITDLESGSTLVTSNPVEVAASAGDPAVATLDLRLTNAKLWSAERPHLYGLQIDLSDAQGQTLETIPWRFGVRKYEQRGGKFFVNDRAVKLKGVNRHEHHPRTGRYVDRETMERDVVLMKRANINFVRTCHYPNDPYWYTLCDEYGLYVMDEANQESHAYGTGNRFLGDDPAWRQSHVDRAVSMAERDKNHPCVAIWSLGNEGGAGANIRAMREAVERIDGTRPVYYHADPEQSDWLDIDYPTVDQVDKYFAANPAKGLLVREYAHAMGNSVGNLTEHVERMYRYDTYVGAAIWDWVDQALARPADGRMKLGDNPSNLTLRDGETWAYGGHFGDYPNDGDFCLNGLLAADREPHPHYYEVQRAYQPVKLRLTPDGRLKVTNRCHFTNLSEFRWNWTRSLDGVVVTSGSLTPPDVPPGESRVLTVPLGVLPIGDARIDTVEVRVTVRDRTRWAPAGWAVASEQALLSEAKAPEAINLADKLSVEDSGAIIAVSCQNGVWEWDRQTGRLVSWSHNVQPLLAGEMFVSFWKPANRNQAGNDYAEERLIWRKASEPSRPESVEVTRRPGSVEVAVNHVLPEPSASVRVAYTAHASGQLSVVARYEPTTSRIAPSLPRFGLEFQTTGPVERVAWLGRGPHENYPDRNRSALLGIYEAPLERFHTNYIFPQDNGARTGVRWLQLQRPSGRALRIDTEEPLIVRVWPYSASDVERATHQSELPRRENVTVHLDAAIHGVGGDNSWGKRTMAKYTLPANRPQVFSVLISPANTSSTVASTP